MTIKAIASKKRDSKEKVEANLSEAIRVYISILGTRENFLVYNIVFEMGELFRKQGKYSECLQMFKKGGDFLKTYFNDKVIYGNTTVGYNHPAMQQFFSCMFQLDTIKKNRKGADEMLEAM